MFSSSAAGDPTTEQEQRRHGRLVAVLIALSRARVPITITAGAVAVAMFAVETFERDTGHGLMLMLFAPVVAASLALGTRLGLAFSAGTFALVAAHLVLVHEATLHIEDLVAAAVAYLGVGLGVGSAAETARRAHLGQSALVARLRTDRELYSTIVETAQEGVLVSDTSGRVIFANRRAAELVGLPLAEIIGRDSAEFAHPSQSAEVHERRARRLAGLSDQYDMQLRRPDGSDAWVLVNGSPLRGSDGAVTGTVALLTDITERKIAEDELRASEERYRSIVQTSQEAIWATDAHGHITFLNEAGGHMTGYTPDELLGRQAREIIEGPDTDRIVDRIRTGARVSVWRTQIVRKDGSKVDVSVNAMPAVNGDGRITGITGTATDITHRREAEIQRELSSNIIRSSVDGILAVDRDYRITVWNPEMEQMTGMPAPEVLGRNVFEGFPFLAEIGEDQNFRQALRGESASSVERPFVVPETARHGFFDAHYSPLRDRMEATLGALVIVRDVSQRRRQDQALRDANERFARAFEDAPIGMALVEPTGSSEGQFVKVNDAFCKIVGFRERELLGKRWQDITPVDGDEETESVHIDALIAGAISRYELEKRYLRPNGDIVWVLVTASLARDPAGEPLYVIKHVEDITARREANDAMRRLVATVESAEDAIYGTDAEHRIVSWNAAAERLYGYGRDEAIGQHVDLIVPDRLREPESAVHDAAASGMAIRQYETTRRRKDGSEVPVSLTKSPVRSGGAIVGVSTIAHDVSDRLRTERERADLEGRLRQWERLETVGQLAGGVAHDFNNLLAVILNYVHFLAEELDGDPRLREDVAEIRQAAERAAALTRQLLLFSRRQQARREPLDLDELVEGTRKMLRRLLEEDITLETDLAGDLPAIMGDAGQVEQILVNLVVNARDAMPAGGSLEITTGQNTLAETRVCTSGTLRPGDYVQLRIRDHGEGIPAEFVEHIFEPFFTTKPHGDGTGLGLATVYGIVARADGAIDVQTGPDGTEFCVWWPVAEAPADRASLTEPQRGPDTAPDPELGSSTAQVGPVPTRVLLVEDDDAVRTVAHRILVRHGFDVLDAASGKDAVARCRGGLEPIDIVLSDVVMPGMSGPELVRRVRELYRDIPVVFMSGYTDDVLVRQGAAGDVRLVDKPFSSETLIGALEGALSPQVVNAS